MRRCSTSIIAKRFQVKTTMRYKYTFPRRANVDKKKRQKITSVKEDRKKNTHAILVGMQKVTTSVENHMLTHYSFQHGIIIQSSHSISGQKHERCESSDLYQHIFVAALFPTAKKSTQSRCPEYAQTDKWISKIAIGKCIPQNGILLSLPKKGNSDTWCTMSEP